MHNYLLSPICVQNYNDDDHLCSNFHSHQIIRCIDVGFEINICTGIHDLAFKSPFKFIHCYPFLASKGRVHRSYLYIEVDNSYWWKPEGNGRTKDCIPATIIATMMKSWLQIVKYGEKQRYMLLCQNFPTDLSLHTREQCVIVKTILLQDNSLYMKNIDNEYFIISNTFW